MRVRLCDSVLLLLLLLIFANLFEKLGNKNQQAVKVFLNGYRSNKAFYSNQNENFCFSLELYVY